MVSFCRSANSLKDKDDKRQPNSPGRKKAIKKGSPTTEPSSPASPRGRKRKNTGKNGGTITINDQKENENNNTDFLKYI